MYPNFKTKPFNHQLQALGCSWDKTNFAYFMEMGTGKSKVLIDNIAMLMPDALAAGTHFGYFLLASAFCFERPHFLNPPPFLGDPISTQSSLNHLVSPP